MKKLFLTSVAYLVIHQITELLPDKPSNLKLAFIPTASNLYKEKDWVVKDRDSLIEIGFNVEDVDIEGKTKKYLEEKLADVDVVFVAGGNTFYLLEKVKESGFDEIIKDLINKGVIYIGSSAGSALVAPTIAAIDGLDDPSDAPALESYESLNLVPFLVLPHYQDESYKKQYETIIKEWKHKEYELKLITNTQALIVDGEKVTLVEA